MNIKKINYVIIYISFIILFTTQLFSQNYEPPRLDPYNPDYVKGTILIKFTDDTNIPKALRRSVAKVDLNQDALFSVGTIDSLSRSYGLISINKVFRQTERRAIPKLIEMPDDQPPLFGPLSKLGLFDLICI